MIFVSKLYLCQVMVSNGDIKVNQLPPHTHGSLLLLNCGGSLSNLLTHFITLSMGVTHSAS